MVKSKRGSRTLAIAVIAAMIMSLFAAFPGFARAQETKSAGNLENGKSYEVPISGLELDTKIPVQPVANAVKTGGFDGNAIVKVDKDGNREASIKFKTIEINMMGSTFYANIKDMSVYQNNDNTTGAKTNVDGTRRDAKCSSMAGEVTTENVIDVAKFALQKNTSGKYDDYIRVNVVVDFMEKMTPGRNYDAKIILDYANAKEIESQEPGTDTGEPTNPDEGEGTDQEKPETPSVDKSGLQSAYDAVAAMTQGNYTADSWADFVSARDAAKAVLNNSEATADQVAQAIKNLQAAKDALAYDNILNLADGTYKVPVKLWHETKDQASMAASSVLPEAMITVSGKDIKMNIYTQPMTMGTITASLQTLKVENGTGGYTDADIVGRSSSGDPNEFSFALPHAKEYINVLVNPKVAIMGNTDIGARLKVDYSSIAKVENAESDINANATATTTTTATPNSPKTGDEAPMALLATLMLLSCGIGVYAYRKR